MEGTTVPIGSKSYYDSLDPSINHPEPKLAMFRKNDNPAAKSGQPAPKSKPADADTAMAATQHIDAVVTQIIELATRTGAVLQRAEEMARRAEEIFCSVSEAAERAEAAAMRAELAASRTELNVITTAMSGQTSEEDVDEEGLHRTQELEMVAQITEKLRNGIQQIEGLTATYSDVDVSPAEVVTPDLQVVNTDETSHAAALTEADAIPSAPIGGILSDFDRAGMSPRSSFARTSSSPNPSDALARSLVSVSHDTGIPRVSPYIIQVPASSDSGSSRLNGHDGPVNIAV